MVAEPGSRRRGLAVEALRLFMAYCSSRLGVVRFTAKIGDGNRASISLFAGKLGFRETRRVACFNEVHFELDTADGGGGGDDGDVADGADGGAAFKEAASAAAAVSRAELVALGAALRISSYDNGGGSSESRDDQPGATPVQ